MCIGAEAILQNQPGPSMDIVENLNGSLIQHGPYSSRIYLMRLDTKDTLGLITRLDAMALEKGYGKIFAKIPEPEWYAFESANYIKEAVVPKFFEGRTDGYFISKYFDARRESEPNEKNHLSFIGQAQNGLVGPSNRIGRAMRDVVLCTPADAAEMSAIYRKVFKSYPFPIHRPSYLKQMMSKDVFYYCIRVEGKMVALAAADVDYAHKNTEMTDFATMPEWRSMGLAGMLLIHMDAKARALGIQTAYTIARMASEGINFLFKKNGYHYSGLLKNNTQIGGSIESMTVWYKHL